MTDLTRNTTQLKPPWLLMARLAWIAITVVTLVVFVLGTIDVQKSGLPSCTEPGSSCVFWDVSKEDNQVAAEMGWNTGLLRGYQLVGVWFAKLAFFLLALLIFLRRPDDWMAMLLSITLMTFTLEGIGEIGFNLSMGTAILFLGGFLFFILPFIFPNGRFEPRWTVWMLAFVLLENVIQYIWFEGLLPIVAIWFLVAGYSVVYRYRKASTVVERQQIKWVMAGFLGWAIGFILQFVVGNQFPPGEPTQARVWMMALYNQPLYIISLMLIPVTITIAVLRYRLWSIDIIIRRTLMYGALTAALALVFFGTVTILLSIFQALSGTQSAFSIVISTLAIAALFNPLRLRFQSTIDRRFYRSRYDAQKSLEAFAAIARNQVEIEEVTAQLMRVVETTLHPRIVSLILRPTVGKL